MLDLDWKLAGSAAVGIITFVEFSWLASVIWNDYDWTAADSIEWGMMHNAPKSNMTYSQAADFSMFVLGDELVLLILTAPNG